MVETDHYDQMETKLVGNSSSRIYLTKPIAHAVTGYRMCKIFAKNFAFSKRETKSLPRHQLS